MDKTSSPGPTEADVRAAVSIEPEVIQEEYARVPQDTHHYKRLLASVQADVEVAELHAEREESRVHEELRRKSNDAKRGDEDYMTADDIKAKVKGSAERAKAIAAAIDKRKHRDELRAIVDAIKMKGEMLVSLGADLREQRAGNRARGG